jgi:hypothetical protein
MASVNSPPPVVTLTLQQVEDLNLEQTATFENEAAKTAFQNALDAAKYLRDELGVDNPVIQIPLPSNAETLGLTADKLKEGAESLSFSITELMVLLHQLGTEMKKAGKEARAAARDSEVATLQAAAEKIKAAGVFALAAGLTGGIMQIAGGMMSGLGAIRSANTAAGKTQNITESTGKLDTLKQKLFYTTASKDATPTGPVGKDGKPTWSMDQVKEFGGKAERVSARWNASSQITQGIGNSVKAGLEYGSTEQEHGKALLEAEAKHIGYLVQNQDEIVNNMKEMMADVRAKLAEIEQANNATISKIWT